MGERRFGTSISLSRTGSTDVDQMFREVFMEISGGIPEIKNQKPDHKLEARNDCVLSFLSKGLLPTLRDSETNLSTNDVVEIAVFFVKSFQNKHPQDFDLDNPIDIVYMAEERTKRLMILYQSKPAKPKNIQKVELLKKAKQLLNKTLGDLTGFDGNENDLL